MPVSLFTYNSERFMIYSIQAYHSSLNEEPDVRLVGNMSVLPIKTKIRGPAPLGMAILHSSKNLVTSRSSSRT